MSSRRAVFLDRDGVLNRLVLRNGQAAAPRTLGEFTLLPGVAAAVAALRRAALLVVVVTNQPDVARGTLQTAELSRMHDLLRRAAPVDAIYTCPHDDVDRCSCRKPKPGLLWRACRKWNIRVGASFLVGDTWRDMAAGTAAGCVTIATAPSNTGDSRLRADFVAADLPAAARLVLEALHRPGSSLRRPALVGEERPMTGLEHELP